MDRGRAVGIKGRVHGGLNFIPDLTTSLLSCLAATYTYLQPTMFTCDTCGVPFTQKCHLLRHRRKQHPYRPGVEDEEEEEGGRGGRDGRRDGRAGGGRVDEEGRDRGRAGGGGRAGEARRGASHNPRHFVCGDCCRTFTRSSHLKRHRQHESPRSPGRPQRRRVMGVTPEPLEPPSKRRRMGSPPQEGGNVVLAETAHPPRDPLPPAKPSTSEQPNDEVMEGPHPPLNDPGPPLQRDEERVTTHDALCVGIAVGRLPDRHI